MPPKKHSAPHRTTQLPASLRTELEQLGHLKPKSKSQTTRKDRRQAKKDDSKAARAAHFASKKRKPEDREQEVEEERAEQKPPKKQKQKQNESGVKDAKAKKGPEEPAVQEIKKMTPLERMLAKQEGKINVVDPARKRTKAETDEDKEIAWLEAKLGVSQKGKWKEEVADDGLDDLFDDLDGIEKAAFGHTQKDYAKLLKSKGASDLDDDFGDDDDDEGDSDDLHHDRHQDDSDDEGDSAADYGLSDEELIDPGDDDDHEEMGEIGSGGSSDEDGGIMDLEEDIGSEEDSGADPEEDEASDEEDGGRTVRFSNDREVAGSSSNPAVKSAPDTSAPAAGSSTRYIPPHLRAKAAAEAAAATAAPAPTARDDAPPEDPRLRRQILGHLNKLSPGNLPSILAAIEGVYGGNPRATVTATLTSVLLSIVASKDDVGHQLVISYAAFVAALSRTVGIEFPATVIAKSVALFDEARARGVGHEEGGFEGRPGSKECENVVGFLCELYNFQVVACVLVYDLVRMFIDDGLGELEVELLSKVIKRAGQQLRQDDPSALKDIISSVKQKLQGIEPTSMNSRTKFMLESLTNLKNNKIKATGEGAVDHYSGLKKFLSGMKKRNGTTPEPLRLTLSDIRASTTKGKWWIVGAAWSGNPLVDQPLQIQQSDASTDAALSKLARAQGMNTDIRKSVFVVLMSSEDYADACERLLQLGLTDVQQREIARVVLQCCGNEKAYNPYYTLVAARMASKSHSFQITLQYCLWDFFRELGEKSVGGQEMVKSLGDDDGTESKVSSRRVANVAKLFAWCVAKEALSLAILKPVPFGKPRPQTIDFLQQFFVALIKSSQSLSPALILSTTATRKDRDALERVFVKVAPLGGLVKGLMMFFEVIMHDVGGLKGEQEKSLIKWGVKVVEQTLGLGSSIVTL